MSVLEQARKVMGRIIPPRAACERSERSETPPCPAKSENLVDTPENREGSEGRGPWHAEAADSALRSTLATITEAEGLPWLTRAMGNVLAVMRQQTQHYRARHDPQLFGAAGWIKAHVERWRAAREETRSR
jgi:hypothetical protein